MRTNRIHLNPLGWLLITLCVLVAGFAGSRHLLGQHAYNPGKDAAAPTIQSYYLPLQVVPGSNGSRLQVARIDCEPPSMVLSFVLGSCRLQLGFVDVAPTVQDELDSVAQEPAPVSLWTRLGLGSGPADGER